MGMDADVGAAGCCCGAKRRRYAATVRVWRLGANMLSILVSWLIVIAGSNVSRRVANDCAAELATGGGVASTWGTSAG